jgi:hypothetical protein
MSSRVNALPDRLGRGSRGLAAGIVGVGLLLAGCGGDDGNGGPRPDRDRARAPGRSSAVTIEQRGGPGAVPFLHVVSSTDSAFLARGFPKVNGSATLVRERIRAGDYTLSSWVRRRSGSSSLGPRADRCTAPLRVPPATAVSATIVRHRGEPCYVAVRYIAFVDLLDLDLDTASVATKRRGFELRVVRRDGRALPHTLDLRFDRVNVAVENGHVTAVSGIY